MTEKKLAGLTISGLARFIPAKRTKGDCIGEPYFKATKSEWGAIPCRVLRLWAILIVKNCKNAWEERMVMMLGKNDKINTPQFMCGYYHKGYKQKIYCQACQRIIHIFELKESDLK